jgi:hypothetical protein
MSACLWTDIDDYLYTTIHAQMGADSAYTTLQVRDVIIDEVWGLDEAKRNNKFPLVLIYSDTSEIEPGAHGGGVVRFANEYTYRLVAVISTTVGKRQCKRDTKEMRRRLREILRYGMTPGANSFGSLVSSDGERFKNIDYGTAEIQIFGRADQDTGTYYGVTWQDFRILTEG